MTIDGAWCAVGSSNFDDRSFETNDEITVGFLDAEAWRRRGLWHRLQDNALYLFNEVL